MKLHWMPFIVLSLSVSLAHAAKPGDTDLSPWELKGSAAWSPAFDQYLMVYTNVTGTGPNIYGRVLSTESAIPKGKDFPLSTLDGSMSKAVLAYNPRTQTFLVVWGRKLYAESRSEIIGLNVGRDGQVIGSEFTVSFSDKFDERPSIAYCPKGDSYLVTWTRTTLYDFESGDGDVYAQMIGGDGTTLVAGNFAIAAADNNQFKPEVTCNALTDQFLVVWEDQRNKTTTQDDIYGQLVASSGAPVGGNFLISSRPDVERRPYVAASTRTGNYLVTWEGIIDGQPGLLSQNLDPTAKLLGPVQPFGTEVGGGQDRPAVAYLKSQDVYFVAWANAAFEGRGGGIFGQFFDGNGQVRQTSFPLTTAKSEQYRPDVAAATNSFLALWTDFRLTGDTTQKDHTYEYFGRVIGNDTPLSARWRDPGAK